MKITNVLTLLILILFSSVCIANENEIDEQLYYQIVVRDCSYGFSKGACECAYKNEWNKLSSEAKVFLNVAIGGSSSPVTPQEYEQNLIKKYGVQFRELEYQLFEEQLYRVDQNIQSCI